MRFLRPTRHDWLEAIIGLPDQLFYNTGISTYIWIITNRKSPARKGRVQLIDATAMFEKMRRSLGNKRNLVPDAAIREITRQLRERAEGEHSKIFANQDFGYWRITVERPLRLNFAITPARLAALADIPAFKALGSSRKKGAAGTAEAAEGSTLKAAILETLRRSAAERVWQDREAFADHLRALFKKARVKLPTPLFNAILAGLGERDETAAPCRKGGAPEPDPELRDTENVPLADDIGAYFAREVLPHVPDAWIDAGKTRKGYEIPFTRHFYRYTPPRPLAEIDADLKQLSAEIFSLLREIAG